MSNPAPLSRTKNVRAPGFAVDPSSIRAWAALLVNFHALPTRFSMSARASTGSSSAVRPSSTTSSTALLRLGQRELLDRGADERRQVYQLAVHFAPGHAREREQPVNQRAHLPRVQDDLLQPVLPLRVELVAVGIEEHVGEAVHAAQRGAEVVGDGVAESLELAARGLGDVLRLREGLLGLPARGDVANHLRRADQAAGRVADRGARHGDVHLPAVLAEPHCVEALDVPGRQAFEDLRLLVRTIRGDQARDGLSDHLVGRVAEEALRSAVPARDDALEGLADDRVVRSLHQARQKEPLLLGLT